MLSAATKTMLQQLDEGLPPPADAGLFGADVPAAEAGLILYPVPWEATTSYGRGTVHGPRVVKAASHQLDLFDLRLGKPFLAGITLLDEDVDLIGWNGEASAAAERVIAAFSEGEDPLKEDLAVVNRLSVALNERVFAETKRWLDRDKFVGLLGGDHSAPLGFMQALAEKHRDGYGVLHVDAHHDLRKAYEGFRYSHASIMYNALEEIPGIKKMVQVAIRDFSRFEHDYARDNPKVTTFYDPELFRRRAQGERFAETTLAILNELPEKVYVSFDIDGLKPSFCPNTGTPVPGGLEFEEAMYLLEELALCGKKVIGFDLCEVAPGEDDEWDANVGARVLYKLCGTLLKSQGMC